MKILILCTYPIASPKHGGQLRVHNIVDSYRSAGYDVEVAGVLGSDHYQREKGFLAFPGQNILAGVIKHPFLMEDYAIGKLFAENNFYYKKLVALINSIPDVIQIEQPWLFAFAQRFAIKKKIKPTFIYSSQNIEWQLKQDIICTYMGPVVAKDYSNQIKKTEENAIKSADVILCVSENDENFLKSISSKPIVLAPNGVKEWLVTSVGRIEALEITKGYRYALYCASAHPPNMTGFFDMFGGGFGSLKPDEKLVCAGGVSFAIASDVRIHQSSKLVEKVITAGIVSESCLGGLLDGAQCIVLPITQGGGTNLKTAEALWSGKHIVATSIAMRGFEKFIGSAGVHIADNSTDFKIALRSAMKAHPLELSSKDVEIRRTVLWKDCLKLLLSFMAKHLEE